jgi:hypothetical protein
MSDALTRPWALCAVLFLLPAHASADACPTGCGDLPCHLKAARCLIEAGKAKQVKDQLRPLVGEHPESAELHLLLARAYLDLGNTVWARRVLYQAARGSLDKDCQVRAWLIWIHLGKAELDLARSLLDEGSCPGGDSTTAARWHLLRATLARHRQQPEKAREQVVAARDAADLLPEDQDLLAWLDGYARPGALPPVQLRAEAGVGYTTNGVMSSPVDPSSPGITAETKSPVMTLDLLASFEPPWGRRVRPLLEAGLRSLVLFDSSVKDYTYFNMSLRPGLSLGRALRLYYRGQLFLLSGDDKYDEGPRTFYETHRGELEWEASSRVSLWAGGGRSIFREKPRTRTELDGGVGLTLQPWRLRVLTAVSLRGHLAANAADCCDPVGTCSCKPYNLFGATVLGSATMPAGPLSLRARLVLSLDYLPDSKGYFDANNHRRDLLVKGAAEAWSPSWHGLRAGLSYEVSHRASTASLYEYTDHRVLGRLRWRIGWDPWAPGVASPPRGHVPLPYGVSGAGGGLEDERIQDLLRQEDAAQRGSSCID